ncbi:MFS transporter [Chitinophaga japonensis]|uniref:Putative MFS family arabinose efflux permease n=1 Tax=Chitinophaga japonensis TaxID=104662 RepID=A0A562T6R3_CHIJA|nr:MFS transporter [Chitinophaga japonensis]TWI89182.1 putative MFS family arabinose efflux permease [Chitinophaga japonensis]
MLSLYKKAFSGLSRSNWWLALILLINRSGNMVMPFLTIYLTQHLHFSLSEAGLVLAMFGIGAILGALAGGRLADRIGFYPVQFWSLLLNGLLFIVLGYMRTLLQICSCTFVLSLVGEAFRPASSAAVVWYSKPENRVRSYALNRLAVNLGFSIGPALGGILAAVSYRFLFWADGLTCIAAALLMRIFLPPARVKPGAAADKDVPRVKGPSVYRDTLYLAFIVLVCCYAMCFFQLTSLVSVYFKTVLHLQEFYIGLALALNGLLVALLEMVLVYKLEGRKDPLAYIWRGILLNGLAYLSFNLLPAAGIVAIIFILLFTLSEMLSMPFMTAFWISRSADHNRGQYAALYTIAYSVAQIISPSLGAFTVQKLGFTSWWYIVAAGCVLTAAGYGWMYRKVVKSR